MAKKRAKKGGSAAGTYVYDKELGRMVQVSDRIPKVSSKAGRSEPAPAPCGRPRGSCGSGGCG